MEPVQCSKQCGKGIRTRLVRCVDTTGLDQPPNTTSSTVSPTPPHPTSSIFTDDTNCNASARPVDEHKCREAHCPRWHRGQWGDCSASCGWGIARREVHCRRGRVKRVPDSECFTVATKPFETRKCSVAECPAYRWRVTPWSKV